MMEYHVRFRPGRFKYAPSNLPNLQQPTWIVGREDDGAMIAFVFDENAAKQICFALNLADAYLTGDTAARLSLTRELEKLHS